MNKVQRTLSALLLGLLAACTGTVEEGPRPVLLALDGEELRAYAAPALNASALTPVARRTVPGARDLATLSGSRRAAVAAGPRLIVVDAELSDLGEFPAPGFAPCWVRVTVSPPRDRVAALSACPNEPLRLAVYSDARALLWERTLLPPTPLTLDGVDLAVAGDVAWVLRPALGGGSTLLTFRRDTPAPQETPLEASFALAVRGAVPLVAGEGGVREVSAAGVPGTPLFTGDTRRLLFQDGLLAAAQTAPVQRLELRRGDGAGQAPLFGNLADLALGPDSYLYLLREGGGGLARVDVARLGPNLAARALFTPDTFADPRALAVLLR